MQLLLDTHVALWWFENDKKIGSSSRRTIQNAEEVFVSVASAWEIVEKTRKGRLKLLKPFEELMAESQFKSLSLDLRHVVTFREMHAHHGDPFDRMLIAQAISEELIFVTVDRHMPQYPVKLLNPRD